MIFGLASRGSTNFYPRPPRGGRRSCYFNLLIEPPFLSTPSARRATAVPALRARRGARFLSTPSARRATSACAMRATMPRYFYPRPPRGGRPSLRARTGKQIYFYPRPPRGGRRQRTETGDTAQPFTIHALRDEGDVVMSDCRRWKNNFFPRPPRGGRRNCVFHLGIVLGISIHALREEGDTGTMAATLACSTISIHALREEGDWLNSCRKFWPNNFYPRPPRGGRPLRQRDGGTTDYISIHALREEGDGCTCHSRPDAGHFYPRPPRGGRLSRQNPGVPP